MVETALAEEEMPRDIWGDEVEVLAPQTNRNWSPMDQPTKEVGSWQVPDKACQVTTIGARALQSTA